MSTDRANSAPRARTAFGRAALYLGLWLVLLPSAKPADAALGIAVAAAAAWISLRLRPPACGRLRPAVLLSLVPHFLWESVRAGIDVARRALAPRVRLNPGFINFPTQFPPGLARNRFATVASLMPGTVAAGDDDGTLVVHCLDIAQPVGEQLCEEERLYTPALQAGARDG